MSVTVPTSASSRYTRYPARSASGDALQPIPSEVGPLPVTASPLGGAGAASSKGTAVTVVTEVSSP